MIVYFPLSLFKACSAKCVAGASAGTLRCNLHDHRPLGVPVFGRLAGFSVSTFFVNPSPGTIGCRSQYQMPSSRFKNRVALPGAGCASCAGSHRECSRLTSVNRGSFARFFHSWGSSRWS